MKYSIPYYDNFRYFDKIDEIILNYSNNDDNIIEFVKNNYTPEQRIIVDVTQKLIEHGGDYLDEMIPTLKKFYESHNNMTVKTSFFHFEQLADECIPYFFIEQCTTKEDVFAYISAGASDVYIVNDLGFDIVEVGNYCHRKDVNVRVYPNIRQYGSYEADYLPQIAGFFIRPEDIKLYEPYVDICEFLAPNDRLSVLYEIYTQGYWQGDLQYLIGGLEEITPNATILPLFGENRLTCKHKCMLENCNLCMRYQTNALVFQDNPEMFLDFVDFLNNYSVDERQFLSTEQEEEEEEEDEIDESETIEENN